jgi:hypothetical protein
VTLTLSSIALRNQLRSVTVRAAVIFDLARRLGVAASQLSVELDAPTGAAAASRELVTVIVSVSDVSLSFLQSAASQINATTSASWLVDTASALRSSGETNTTIVVLGAAAEPAPTLPPSMTLGSSISFCEANVARCAGPAVGGFCFIVVLVLVFRRRAQNRRLAIEAVHEMQVTQHTHQQNWFQAAADEDAGRAAAGTQSTPLARGLAHNPLDDDDDDALANAYLRDLQGTNNPHDL